MTTPAKRETEALENKITKMYNFDTDEDRERAKECIAICARQSAVKAKDMREALASCLSLIDDMSRFVGSMSLQDYALFNEAPMKARAALRASNGENIE